MIEMDLLAYCGLYCGDCAGYSGEIADAAKILIESLERYRFDRTAKSLFADELGDYDRFREALEFVSGLRCPRICRKREEGETDCEIWKCCRTKGYYACYECEDFEVCTKLKGHEALHGDSCVTNLRAIREMGLEVWVASGERLWFGSEESKGT